MTAIQQPMPKTLKPPRESGLELFRVISMFFIVAHHYVVNSGLIDVMYANPLSSRSIFMFLFGMWGKTGINCFVLITGYFMCTSRITLRKYLKLLSMLWFYNVIIYVLFAVFGYESVDAKSIIYMLLPVQSVSNGFISCYFLFYLTIPFLNILIRSMNRLQHFMAVGLGLGIYTGLGSLPFFTVQMNYVSWFIVLFLVGSYLRMYPCKLLRNNMIIGRVALVVIFLAMLSVIGSLYIPFIFPLQENSRLSYYWVADSNKIFAVLVSVSSFMFFKNLKWRYNKFINTMAAATFGVLLIHANSDAMREWLWRDIFDNVGWFCGVVGSGSFGAVVLHAVTSVVLVYVVSTLIEFVREKTIEIPILDALEKMVLKAWKRFNLFNL